MPDIVVLCQFRQSFNEETWVQGRGAERQQMGVRKSAQVHGFVFYHQIHLLFQSSGTISLQLTITACDG